MEFASKRAMIQRKMRDAAQRRRLALPCRERQPVSLARPVIGILAEDHHLHRLEGRAAEGIEPVRARRIDVLAGTFLGAQELAQLLHVRLFELVRELGEPGRLQVDARSAAHGASRVRTMRGTSRPARIGPTRDEETT